MLTPRQMAECGSLVENRPPINDQYVTLAQLLSHQ